MNRNRIIGLTVLLGLAMLWGWSIGPMIDPKFDCPINGPTDQTAAGSQDQRIEFLMGRTMDLNLASEADLTVLPGVGPGLARRIAAFRKKNGPFTSVDQLTGVRGVGPARMKKIGPFLSVAGN